MFVVWMMFLLLAFNCHGRKSRARVKQFELERLVENLWREDKRIANVVYYLQGQLRKNHSDTDEAPDRFFGQLGIDNFNRPTINSFINLLDNFEANVTIKENYTLFEMEEVEEFLTNLLNTTVFQIAWDFLVAKNYSSTDEKLFKDQLHRLWFGLYSKRRTAFNSSCGFEHTFVGEIRRFRVTGFHSWIRFYLAEKEGTVNYLGYYKFRNLDQYGMLVEKKFSWDGFTKRISTFFVGTSPEFEFALYTICALARPNSRCKFILNDHVVHVQTNILRHQSGEISVFGAYPLIIDKRNSSF